MVRVREEREAVTGLVQENVHAAAAHTGSDREQEIIVSREDPEEAGREGEDESESEQSVREPNRFRVSEIGTQECEEDGEDEPEEGGEETEPRQGNPQDMRTQQAEGENAAHSERHFPHP